MAAGVKSQ